MTEFELEGVKYVLPDLRVDSFFTRESGTKYSVVILEGPHREHSFNLFNIRVTDDGSEVVYDIEHPPETPQEDRDAYLEIAKNMIYFSITQQFEFVDNWKPANDATRKLIRRGGWAEVAAGGVRNLGVISLGNIDPGDTAKTDFTYDGPLTKYNSLKAEEESENASPE